MGFGWDLPPGCSLADIDALFGDDDEGWPEETIDEDDEVTGGHHYSDEGDYGDGRAFDQNLAYEQSEADALHDRLAQDNPAYATAEEVAMADLYDM